MRPFSSHRNRPPTPVTETAGYGSGSRSPIAVSDAGVMVVVTASWSADSGRPAACGTVPNPRPAPSGAFGAHVRPVKSSSTARRR
nr:hypothetical protein [Amnibacterium setariae]